MPGKKKDLSRPLRPLKAALDTWRTRAESPKRIPHEIWRRAMMAADKHGVGPVASHLGLDHSRLKAKLTLRKATASVPSGEVLATFIEFLPPTPAALSRCVIVRDRDGW